MPYTYLRTICEDKNHRLFLRPVLIKFLGLTKKQLRLDALGSESKLRDTLPQHVVECKGASNNRTRLLICIDGDNFGWKKRCKQATDSFDGELHPEVFGIVPEIEIEWWILELVGQPLGDDPQALTSDRKRYAEAKIPEAVGEFIKRLNQPAPPHNWSESLKLAHKKLNDLKASLNLS